MAEVGTAYVTLLPSTKGFGSKVSRQIGGDLGTAGTRGGEQFGKGFAKTGRSRVSAFGSSIKSLLGPAALLAGGAAAVGFVKGAIGEAREAQKVGAQTEAVLKSTGGAAGVTAQQIGDLANSISLKTGIDDEAIQSGENLLLTFTNVRNEVGKGNDIFSQATETATDMSAALGQDTKSSVIQLGKALNDPIKGITALSRVGVTFTEQQKAQITALTESGKTMQAQKLIIGELNKEFGGSAEAIATPAEKAQVAWANFQEQVGTALLPVLDKLLVFFAQALLPAVIKFGKFLGDNKGILYAVAAAFGVWATATLAVAAAGAIQTATMFAQTAATYGLSYALKSGGTAAKTYAAAQWLVNAAMAANPITLVVIALIALVAAFVIAYKKSETFRKIVNGAFEAVKTVAGKVFGWLKDAVANVIGFVKDHWKLLVAIIAGPLGLIALLVVRNLDKIKAFFANAWAAIKAVAGAAWDGITGVVSGGASKLVDAVKAIPGKLKALGGLFRDAGKGLINGFIEGMKNAGDFIGGIAGSIWDVVKGLLNDAITSINEHLVIDLPFGKSIDPPDIPLLATGGRATGATLAIIGEGREPESVLPDSVLSGLLTRAGDAGANQGGGGRMFGDVHVEAHDYQDFMLQLQRRSRALSAAHS